MKKQNVKIKNAGGFQSKKVSKGSNLNWMTMTHVMILAIYIFEGIKTITVASKKDYKVIALSIEVSSSIILALIYIGMDLLKKDKNDVSKIYIVSREVVLLGSMILFLFGLQQTLIDTLEHDSEFFLVVTNFVSLASVFMAFGIIQHLLKLSIFSKISIIAYFMLYTCLEGISRPEVNALQICMNTLIPMIYLSLLVLIQWQSEKNIPLPAPPSPSSPAVVEKDLNLAQFVEESIFSYDKRGNLELCNSFYLQFFDDGEVALPANIFKRIKGVNLVSEEKLTGIIIEKDKSEENNMSDFNFELKSESTRHLKEMNHIILNFDESTSPRSYQGDTLDSITKNLYLSTMRKEITEQKVITYFGNMSNGDRFSYYFQIKVYVLPRAKNPLIIVIKDKSSEKVLEEYKACDHLRERLFDCLALEVNNVMDMSKKILEACLQEMKNKKSPEQIKTLFVSSIQQVLTPLIVTVGDLLDFSSTKISKLKFVYAPCDLVKVIEKTVRLFSFVAKIRKIELKAIFPKDCSGPLMVNTDEKRVLQLLIKLLSNSVKCTKNGTINIVVVPSSNSFNISVEDSGKGMSSENLKELKEELKEFHTDDIRLLHSKYSRAQGLAIAQMLAFGIGPKFSKDLSIKSVPKRGTEVSFYVESKLILEDTTQKTPSSSLLGFSSRFGKNNHTPVRPSRFKLNHGSESQESSLLFEEISEGIEIHNIIYSSLEASLSKRNSEVHSSRSPILNELTSKSRSFESKKTKLMTSDQISTFGNPIEF